MSDAEQPTATRDRRATGKTSAVPKGAVLTAGLLRLSAAELRSLRTAGLTLVDLLAMSALDVAAATNEEITEDRAHAIVGRAELLSLGLHPSALEEIGVLCIEDISGRTAEDMWLQVVDQTARTNPRYYDVFCQAVYAAGGGADPELRTVAGWRRRRERDGVDPLLLVWRSRHGQTTRLPRPSGLRLRMPTIGVNAPVSEGGADEHGCLVGPLAQKDVVVDSTGSPRLVLGHWMWNGGHGALVRLEDLRPGDGLQLGDRWFAVTSVDKVPGGPADPALTVEPLVIATTPHRRVGVIGTADMLPPVERGMLRVVARARPAPPESVDTTRRPLRRIGGAY